MKIPLYYLRKYGLLLLSLGILSALYWFHAKTDNLDSLSELKGKEKYAHYEALYDKYRSYNRAALKKIPKQDRPDLAMLQDYLRTADPHTGEIPQGARIQANKYVDAILNNPNRRAIDNVNWFERGPNNVGGRTRAIMYDPNDVTGKKVWAGAVNGGLWYTNDITQANPNWQNINDFWENIAISSIAYDPTNTQVFYVTTGEGWFDVAQGSGIWKTTDGGISWNRLVSTDVSVNKEFTYMQKVVVLANGTVLFSCRSDVGNNGGIYSSTDRGSNWTKVLDGNGGADIEIASNGDIYVTINFHGSSSGEIHKSTDNGITWTNVTPTISSNTRRIELACAPSNAQVVYAIGSKGDVSFFKKTTDGGTTWADVTIPIHLDYDCTPSTDDFTRGQAGYDLILAVNPTDSEHVLVGGIDVYRSTNGGSSWEPISYWTGHCAAYIHADIHAFAYKPGSSDEVLVGCDGGVFHKE